MRNHFPPWRLREEAQGRRQGAEGGQARHEAMDRRGGGWGDQVWDLTVWLPILAGGNKPEEVQRSLHQGALIGRLRDAVRAWA